MKWIYGIISSTFLVIGMIQGPVQVYASQTAIHLEILESDNVIEIDREPSEEERPEKETEKTVQKKKEADGKNKNLPMTNDVYKSSYSILGLLMVVLSLYVIRRSRKNVQKG